MPSPYAARDPLEFDAQDYGREELLRGRVLDLSSARAASNPLEVRAPGRFFWLTGDTTGAVNVRFNDENALSVPAGADFFIEAIGGAVINRVYLDWPAQSGKQAVIAHGTDLRLKPTNDITNLQRIIEPVTVVPGDWRWPLGATSYGRFSATAALQTIVTPAANVSGVVVHSAMGLGISGGGWRCMAKTSAPTGVTDGAAHTLAWHDVTTGHYNRTNAGPTFLPAGVGLYEQCNLGSSSSWAFVSYEVL